MKMLPFRRVQLDRRPVLAIALTGWNQGDTGPRTREAGLNHKLVKPVDYDTLKRLIGESAR
ncbi:hypothetical protein [Massilia glaciei]|uniref:Response regulatory domain-containing protein n=1 Tax=Massilia glaciei TaxID=1524097 RepID=A0A2U2HLZ9_9BURK|nr:hypothetical protein [Massilia glaciei]PWF48530.1 hypothetical protein C7C56_011230 [Massilia glaciei]